MGRRLIGGRKTPYYFQVINMVSETKWHSYILKFLPIILVFCVGFGVGYHFAPEKIVTQTKTEYVQVEGKTKTQVQYVYKESPKDADVEVKNENPKVKINDKTFTFEKLPDEKIKFDKGKVQIEQGYEIKIDAKSLIPKQPKWGVDFGYSNHGYYAGLRHNFNRNVSFHAIGVPKPIDNKDKFYGGGLTINF